MEVTELITGITSSNAITKYTDLWLPMEAKAANTIRARRGALRRAQAITAPVPLADAAIEDLIRWRLTLTGRADSYVLAQVSHIRCFFGWLADQEYRDDNPSVRLPVPRKRELLPHPIGEAELLDVLDSAPPRIRLWVVLAAWCGLRACEIALLRRRCIRDTVASPHILVATDATKGVRERVIPLTNQFVIAEIRAARLPVTGWCFPRLDGQAGPVSPHRVSNLCNELIHGLGYPETLHTLRARAATIMLRETKNVRVVQQFLGHSRLDTTAIYTLVQNDELAAAAAAIPAPRRLRAASLGEQSRTGLRRAS